MHESVDLFLREQEREDQAFERFDARFTVFWTLLTYVNIALPLYDTWVDDPQLLRGWSLAGLVAAIVVFLVTFHRVMLGTPWPIRLRTSVAYGLIQAAVLLVLVRYNPSFGGLGIALIAHLLALLPARYWAIAIGTNLAIMALAWGVAENIAANNWDDVGFTLLQPVIWTVVFIFITQLVRNRYQLKAANAALHSAKRQLEESAAQAEELAALRERTRLAREMHDSIGHALVVVNVKLEAAERLYARDAGRGAAELEATRALVRETMADLRRSLADLRSPLPTHTDLPAALGRLAAEIEARSSLRIELERAPAVPMLRPDVSEALWRVAREALVNVERHAGASSVVVELTVREGQVELRVHDDGSGIAPAELHKSGHYGVVGMRERISALGGTFTLGPRPGGGTTVAALVPLPSALAPAARECQAAAAVRAE